MRPIKTPHLAPAPMTILSPSLLAAVAVLVSVGCRNTTNNPVSPLGSSSLLSPLAPVQGAAPLSPIQPTSGIGSFGSPTRVPPPPTGSYSSPGNYGSASVYGAPVGNAPVGNYAPSAFAPSGADLGSSGLTRGITDLSPANSAAPGVGFDNSVRQTGWVGDSQAGITTFGSGFGPATASGDPSSMGSGTATGARAGGMPVIDLTRAPYPPGYVPPQDRPGAATFPSTAPYPQADHQYPQLNQQPSANQVPLGQSTNSRFVRSSDSWTGSTSYDDGNTLQTASRPNAALPSTEPFPAAASVGSDDLQWRRPSPRF